MFRKKNTDSLDYEKINEGIRIGVEFLKIFFVLTIVLLVFFSTKLIFDWKILQFVGSFLSIISPFFIGIIIAWLFDPLVTKLQNKGVSRVLGTLFVYVLLILFLYLLGQLMIPSITNQLNDLIKSLPSFVNYIKNTLDGFFDGLSNVGEFDFNEIKNNIYNGVNDLSTSLTVDLPSNIMNIISTIISGGVNFLIGLLVGLYMLFDFDDVKSHIKSFIPKKYKKDTLELFHRLNCNLKSYVHGTVLIMCILFVFQSICLAIVGLEAPMVFGLFCAVTDLIPYIGPWVGGIPAVLVGLSISPTTGLFALLAVVLCQSLENYFLQPVVMGKTMKLHPVTIMIGLIVFGHFFGIFGMVFATPIISIFKTIFNFFNEKYEFTQRFKES